MGRRVYVGSMLLLAGGVAGGFASNFSLVLAARASERLAAGVVQPIPAIIILRAFEPQQQGQANGRFGMGVVLAPAIGPSVGGVLVELFGCRSIFFMVVPLCLLSLWMAGSSSPTARLDGRLPIVAALWFSVAGPGRRRNALPPPRSDRPQGT